MSIRKLRAGRVPASNVMTYIGEQGSIFWDESTGNLRLSDGHTAGGHPLPITIATTTTAGVIKAGPGMTVGTDGLLTIDAAGLPISFGDFYATTNNLSTVNANEDFNIISNGTGTVNVVGDFHIHKTADTTAHALAATPVFKVDRTGVTTILVPTTVTSSGGVEIVGNATGAFQTPLNTGVMLHVTGNDPDGVATPSRIYNDAIAGYSGWIGRRYNGTSTSPTAVQSGDEVLRLGANAYTGTGWNAIGSSNIRFISTDNQVIGTAQGMKIDFYSTPQGSGVGSIAKVMTVEAGVGVTATKFVGPLTGNVTGNADTVTNGVYTSGSYSDPSWLTISKSKVGLGSVENTALSTWAGSSNIVTVGNLTNLEVAGTMRYDGAQNNATGNTFNKTGGTVTADGRTGQLTTNNDSIAKGTAATFIVNNSTITSAKDVVIVNIASGGSSNAYAIAVTAVNATGSFHVTVSNNGTGALAEALVINFAIIKVS